MNPGKHVIFLGAGASFGSGYPLANGLRLLISSKEKWENRLAEYETKHFMQRGQIVTPGMEYRKAHADSLDLFRHGGFATLDEFCKLAGASGFHNEIDGLRRMVRAALGLFNPEDHFEGSEYYGFVQSLFKNDLYSLREDVTVLTYNYDPYLPYLLYRALETRRKVRRRGTSSLVADIAEHAAHSLRLNAVTSGFYSLKELAWLGDDGAPPSFCLLQLHGSIGFVMEEIADFEVLFSKPAKDRAARLFHDRAHNIPAPVMFPWEVMGSNGFVDQRSFPNLGCRELYPLFTGIWKRAKREIQAADKISFVGLSMHDFLMDGLRFLFEGKKGVAEIVVANPDNAPHVGGTGHSHWSRVRSCSAFSVSEMLRKMAPNLNRVGTIHGQPMKEDLTLVKDFEEFVRTQMKPVS